MPRIIDAQGNHEPIVGRYWVFDYDWYYPLGGLGDLAGIFDALEEATEFARACDGDEVQVFDREVGAFVGGWEHNWRRGWYE